MKIQKYFTKLSPQQVLVFGFLLLILTGTILLSLPLAVKDGQKLGLLDAWFTATSAASVTGLIVVDTGQTFSLFGQIVLLLLIQTGGIGFMTMTTMIALFLGRKISYKDRLIIKESFNLDHEEGIIRLIRRVLLYSLFIEAIGTLLFAMHWFGEMPAGQALYWGMFHAVSIFNNSGFDLIGGWTAYAGDFYFNVVSIALIFLGSAGFIVLSDLIDYPKKRKLSLHSRVVLMYSAGLIVIGAMLMFIFEYSNEASMGALNPGEKAMAALFHATSLRSSGTSTIPVESMRQATLFLMIILMFIGAAPGSTGGGIKVTTFAIMVAACRAMMQGREDVVLFRNRIDKALVYKAITVTFIALFIVIAAMLMLSFTENLPFLTLLYEVVSAYGTVGFSAGLTSELSGFGKTVLIVLMFAGRLGPFTLALALQSKNGKEKFRYPEGKIILG